LVTLAHQYGDLELARCKKISQVGKLLIDRRNSDTGNSNLIAGRSITSKGRITCGGRNLRNFR
jgi:hypothetical protein